LGCSAFYWEHLQYLGIEEGNSHFLLSGRWLLDFAGKSIIGHVGPAADFFIWRDIEELGEGCLYVHDRLMSVAFEEGSRLRRIGPFAIGFCGHLTSIVIPASVITLAERCFAFSASLSVVGFEPNSQLLLVEEGAFTDCPELKTIWIPSCLETLAVAVFGEWNDVEISILESGARLCLPARDGNEPPWTAQPRRSIPGPQRPSRRGSREVPDSSGGSNEAASAEES
jgi:hypothetical protein